MPERARAYSELGLCTSIAGSGGGIGVFLGCIG